MKPEKLLVTKEAAEILRISEGHLRLLVRQKKIAAYKEGRRGGYRISDQEIENYIAMRQKSCGI